MGKKTVGFADEDDVDEVDDAQDEQQGRRFTANRELRCLPLAWESRVLTTALPCPIFCSEQRAASLGGQNRCSARA
jgi:hypothetical protein